MPFDGTRLDEATQLLIVGRARIEAGWCQNVIEDRGGRFCAVGALTRGGREMPRGLDVALRRLATAAGLRSPSQISKKWNDAPERTQEDVLAAYDRAIML